MINNTYRGAEREKSVLKMEFNSTLGEPRGGAISHCVLFFPRAGSRTRCDSMSAGLGRSRTPRCPNQPSASGAVDSSTTRMGKAAFVLLIAIRSKFVRVIGRPRISMEFRK